MQISETNEIKFPVPMYKADTTKLTLECIHQNEQNGLYDRDISIQRQEQRTTEEKEVFQAGIMNSILCGFKIPPVIINSKCDEKGKCVYRIIDGAHRMRAIIAYLKGEYQIKIKGKFYTINELGDKAKNQIKHCYSIDVIMYTELSPAEESDIFIKYNNVKPLHIGNRIKAEENGIVKHWREIIKQNASEIKKLGKTLANEIEDKFITTLASIYSYIYLQRDAEGGKKCLKQVTNLDEKQISTYEESKENFENAVVLAIKKFNLEKIMKTATQFKLLVILLYTLHVKYFDNGNDSVADKIVSSLKRQIESNTLGKERNNGKKNNIAGMINKIKEDMNLKNE